MMTTSFFAGWFGLFIHSFSLRRFYFILFVRLYHRSALAAPNVTGAEINVYFTHAFGMTATKFGPSNEFTGRAHFLFLVFFFVRAGHWHQSELSSRFISEWNVYFRWNFRAGRISVIIAPSSLCRWSCKSRRFGGGKCGRNSHSISICLTYQSKIDYNVPFRSRQLLCVRVSSV